MISKILSNAYIFLKTLSFILEPYAPASYTLVKWFILLLGVIEEITYHGKCYKCVSYAQDVKDMASLCPVQY